MTPRFSVNKVIKWNITTCQDYFKNILSKDRDDRQSSSSPQEEKYPEYIVYGERLGAVAETILDRLY